LLGEHSHCKVIGKQSLVEEILVRELVPVSGCDCAFGVAVLRCKASGSPRGKGRHHTGGPARPVTGVIQRDNGLDAKAIADVLNESRNDEVVE
jgi:hypothetical protein